MFRIGKHGNPADANQLATAITDGLNEVVSASHPVKLEAKSIDDIARLEIDLDGARLISQDPPPVPKFTADRTPAFTAQYFSVHALPLQVYDSEIRFELTARTVNFDFARDNQGDNWLVPSSNSTAQSGKVKAAVSQDHLAAILLAAVKPMAAAKGVTVTDARVLVTSVGKRAVNVSVEATGKKFGMKATLQATGNLEVDDELVATVSDLQAKGEGFLGSTVSGMLQPKLNQINGSRFPLSALSLGGLKLRDLSIDVGNAILVQAEFGSNA